ncbi:MAG: class I SAM-dependent methyltransferase [Flavobacteriales bacterium]|nr:class I SAM-dependent methyltransferase [Flavobacteriales bacterium]
MKALYIETTKHSHYQRMPRFLEGLIAPEDLRKAHDRFDEQRLDYFASKLDFAGKRVLDIGANTGYFTFEAFERGAREVICYEGNAEHAEFIRCAAGIFDRKVVVQEKYLDFGAPVPEAPFDIVLLLNVLHHVGDDFGDKSITINQARKKIIENMNAFASQTDHIIVQIGFSWQTDYTKPLFPRGSKGEVIEFFRAGIKGYWEEVAIGIAEVSDGVTRYVDLNDGNVQRDDSIGEFRNRPIFILKSVIRS